MIIYRLSSILGINEWFYFIRKESQKRKLN
jgi:hypothetical protein